MKEEEKSCYNTYLRISRSIKNEPFKLRKDFTDFEKDTKYEYVKRLVTFFNQYPHIDMETFFKAPFLIYKDEKYFPLEYFLTQKAVKAYRLYNLYLQNLQPDTNEQLDIIKKSLKFIYNFCKTEKIKIDDYISYKEKDSLVYSWVLHVKEHKVCVYVLFNFPQFQYILYNIPKDEQELFLSEIIKSYATFKTRYEKSIYAKPFIIQGLEKLKKLT
jgi:hypothetical protein